MKSTEEMAYVKRVADQLLIELDTVSDVASGAKPLRSVTESVGRVEGLALALALLGDYVPDVAIDPAPQFRVRGLAR